MITAAFTASNETTVSTRMTSFLLLAAFSVGTVDERISFSLVSYMFVSVPFVVCCALASL